MSKVLVWFVLCPLGIGFLYVALVWLYVLGFLVSDLRDLRRGRKK